MTLTSTAPAAGVRVRGWARPGRGRAVWLTAGRQAHMLVPWMYRLNWAYLTAVRRQALRGRDLELVALRVAWNCGCRDGWVFRHWANRLLFGARRTELIYAGPLAPGWDPRSALMLSAIDQVHDDLAIAPGTWRALGGVLSADERVALLCAAAMYELLAVVLPGLGMPTHLVPALGTRHQLARAGGPGRPRRPVPETARYRPLPHDLNAAVPEVDPGLWSPVCPGITLAALASQPRVLRVLLSAAAARKNSTLPARDAHIVLLRTIHRAGPRREWAPRVGLAMMAGLEAYDLERVCSEDDGSDRHDAALVRAVDELDTGYLITDHTWELLRRKLTPRQLVELTFLVGYHRMLAIAVNTLEGTPAALL